MLSILNFMGLKVSSQHNGEHSLRLDLTILVPIFGLVIIGMLTIMSASSEYSAQYYDTPFYFVIKQGILMVIGVVALIVGMCVPLRFWQGQAPAILFLNILLLLMVFVPTIGREINASSRWLNLGFINFQPSELLKFSLPLFCAAYITHSDMKLRQGLEGLLIPAVALIFVAGLLLLQPDFGSAVVYSITVFAILFFAGMKWQHIMFLIVGAISSGFLLIAIQPYRLLRLLCMEDANIWQYFYNQCYQAGQSLVAIERGGVWGLGLGASIQKNFYLPESYTDFVFAILVEELGMVFGLLLICLFLFLIFRMMSLATHALEQKNYFAAYFVMGIAVLWGLQAMFNMGVSLTYFPITGLTLPFISYGGSSLVVNLFLVGIIMRVFNECSSD